MISVRKNRPEAGPSFHYPTGLVEWPYEEICLLFVLLLRINEMNVVKSQNQIIHILYQNMLEKMYIIKNQLKLNNFSKNLLLNVPYRRPCNLHLLKWMTGLIVGKYFCTLHSSGDSYKI